MLCDSISLLTTRQQRLEPVGRLAHGGGRGLRLFQFGLDTLDCTADSGQRLPCGFWMSERTVDVNPHQLFAGHPHHRADDRQFQFVVADDRMKDHSHVGVEIHFALAQQADCVPVDVELVELDVLEVEVDELLDDELELVVDVEVEVATSVPHH